MPHSFVVGTITDIARAAVEQAGGTVGSARIQPNIPAHLVTLPDTAKIESFSIMCDVFTLRLTRSWQDREGTLDLIV